MEILAIAIHFGAEYRPQSRDIATDKGAGHSRQRKAGGDACSATSKRSELSGSFRLRSFAQRSQRPARARRYRQRTGTLAGCIAARPKNPQVLAEMAAIYESIQLYDGSSATWKKIQDLGPSAGPLRIGRHEITGRRSRDAVAGPGHGHGRQTAGRGRTSGGIRLRCDEH